MLILNNPGTNATSPSTTTTTATTPTATTTSITTNATTAATTTGGLCITINHNAPEISVTHKQIQELNRVVVGMNTHGLVWTTTWFVGTAQSLSPIWTQRTKPVPSTAAPMEENALLLGKNKMIIAHSRALRTVNTTLEPTHLMPFANVARNQTFQVN